MFIYRTIEFTSAAIIGLLNLLTCWLLFPPDTGQFNWLQFAVGVLLQLGPSGLIVAGAYAHAIKRKRWGRKMLWTGGLFALGYSLLYPFVPFSASEQWILNLLMTPDLFIIIALFCSSKIKNDANSI